MSDRPSQSPLHRLHPVVKLVWLLWATVAVFLFDSASLPLIVAGCAVGLLWLAGVAPWRIAGLRLWLTLGVVIVAIQAALVREGEPVLSAVTTGGLTAGLRVFGRLMAIVLLSALFVATTEPYALACGLMRVGLPYRWGFALVTSLRLAPAFRVEAHQVYRAQLVRGVAYDAGGPRRWWLLLRHLCLPLLVSALRTAQWLALSMEGRGFGLHPRRTYTHEPRAAARDFVAIGLLLVSIVVAVLILAR